MRYFKKMEGSMIYLSPVNPDDTDKYTQWINNLPMSLKIGSATDVFSLPREKSIIENMAKEGHNYAIVLKENDELIGNCSLFAINHIHRAAEIGLFIGAETQRNKGYGTEAIQLLADESKSNYLDGILPQQ